MGVGLAEDMLNNLYQCGCARTCSAMTKNGELFVLDRGKSVKICDLAQSMITMTAAEGIEIVETGIRPSKKLHEELLVKMKNWRRRKTI